MSRFVALLFLAGVFAFTVGQWSAGVTSGWTASVAGAALAVALVFTATTKGQRR